MLCGPVYLSTSLSLCRCRSKGTTVDALATFAKIGVRTALNFVFSLLKRAWRKGEDMDMCSEVLQEALVLLEPLPPASLFHTHCLSSVWLDAVDKVTDFLAAISSGRWAAHTHTHTHTRTHAHTHTHTHKHTHTLTYTHTHTPIPLAPLPSERPPSNTSQRATPGWPCLSCWSWLCSAGHCRPC